MEYITFAIFVFLVIIFIKQEKKKREDKEREQVRRIIVNNEFKKTLALGIYQRFCKECEEVRYSQTYLKSDPIDFEHFVADIMQYRYDGEVYVTQGSGDFGVDVEHGIGEGKILGQVKCYKGDVGYEPIALIHSNMQKQKADKGYVVTTGGFTDNAYTYAHDLNVELIDGVRLVELWIEYKKPIVEEIITQS